MSSETERPRILVILSRFPYPLEKGDKLRAYYQIKELSETFDVILVATHEKPVKNEHLVELSKFCIEMHLFRIHFFSKLLHMSLALIKGTPLQTGYFYSFRAALEIRRILSAKKVRHVYCQLIRTAEYVRTVHEIPKTLDYMDTLSYGVKRRIARQHPLIRWVYSVEAKRLSRYEQRVFDYFENKTIISEQDRELIAHPDKDSIVCIPNGVDPAFLKTYTRDEKFDFVFVGNMSYPPNIDAVRFIVTDILPHLPGSTLLIAGANPHPRVLRLREQNKNVQITGWMQDIRDAYLQGRVFLAPMFTGTGLQNKLLEAMALGTPCITSSLANNAVKAKSGEQILVADTQEEFLRACKELMDDPELRKRIAGAGKNFIRDNYQWPECTKPLVTLIGNNLAPRK